MRVWLAEFSGVNEVHIAIDWLASVASGYFLREHFTVSFWAGKAYYRLYLCHCYVGAFYFSGLTIPYSYSSTRK